MAELQESKLRVTTATSENERLQAAIREQTAATSQNDQEQGQNQATLEKLLDRQDALQQTLNERNFEYEKLIHQNEDARRQLTLSQSRIQQLEAALEQNDTPDTDHESLQQHIYDLQAQLADAKSGIARHKSTQTELIAQRDAAIAGQELAQRALGALQEDVANHRRAFDTVERHRLRAVDQLTRSSDDRVQLETQLKEREHTIAALREELDELAETRRNFIAVQTSLQDQTTAFNALKIDRDEIAMELADVKNQMSQWSTRSQSYQQDLDRIREQREELLDNLNREQARNKVLADSLAEQTKRLELIGQEYSALEIASEKTGELQHVIEQQESALAALGHDRDEQLLFIESLEDTVGSLRAELAERNQTIVALERDRDEVLGRLRQQNVMLESHLSHDQTTIDTQDDTEQLATRIDDRRGFIYVRPPAEKDNLQKISGIAAVLEQRLNEFGIYTYKQIMEWDPVAIDEFSELLAFRDRIVRDNWIGQAQDLHRSKYGEAA